MKSPRQWFRLETPASDPAAVDIHIIDVIGSWDDDFWNRYFGEPLFGVTARAFVEQLAALPEAVKMIRLHINSPGGDVQAGINIANALREQQLSKGRTVETFVDGIAASIASVIAMAGSRVVMGDNALMMVHNPWIIAIGNAAELRQTADVLDTVRAQAIATYQWHSQLSSEDIAALMDAETWMDADEAIAKGFATEKVTGLRAAASIDPHAASRLSVPDKYRARVQAFLRPEPAPVAAAAVTEVLRRCREADCLDLAEALIGDGATAAQVEARVTKASAARAAARTRSAEISALCRTAKLPELAAGYIAGVMSLDAVREHLATITAKLDRVEIDAALPPDAGGRPAAARIDTAAIYRERNGQ